MQANKPGKLQSTINVTPLVDVVLVLLIIFMVLTPQLHSGPAMELPTTDQPPKKPENGRQILVAMERSGTIWIDKDQVTAQEFPAQIRQAAAEDRDRQVVIKGDARLTFGEVKQAMRAVEAAGFKNVGLIAERRDEKTAEFKGWN
jgi:biopolymer transport protein TolR